MNPNRGETFSGTTNYVLVICSREECCSWVLQCSVLWPAMPVVYLLRLVSKPFKRDASSFSQSVRHMVAHLHCLQQTK